MSSPAHARYAMSSASTWLTCTASAGLSATVPPLPDEEYSLQGTAAHALLEMCVGTLIFDAALVFADMAAEIPNSELLEPACIEAVQVCLDYVAGLTELDPGATVRSESRVRFAPRPDVCYGTCDIIVDLPTFNAVYVIDYKHGVGMMVEVEENDQILGYGVSAITTHSLSRDRAFVLAIVQPRAHHKRGAVREWHVSIERLDMQRDMMVAAIDDGESDNPTFAPSAERCRWCAGCAVCRVAEQEGLKPFGITSYKQADTAHLPDIDTLDPARLAYMLSAIDLIKAYGKNVFARAMHLARSGVYIPGYKLVEARAERQFEYDTETTLLMLRELTEGQIPDDEFAPRQLTGITDIEAKLKRWARARHTKRNAKNKASEEISQQFALLTTKQSSGNMSLVPETDKRQAAPVTNGMSHIKLLPR